MKADHTGQNVVCISFKYVQTDKKMSESSVTN